MRLSFSTGTLYHLPLRTSFSLAHAAGLDGVELVLGPEVALCGAAHVRRLIQEFRLPVLSVHPPILPYPGMHDTRRILPRLMALAEQVECDLVVLHTPKATSTTDGQWTTFLEALQAARSNPRVRVAVENAGIFAPTDESYLLHDARRLSEFATRYDLPVTLDTSHAGTSSQHELLDALALLEGRVVNVHFSDLARRRVVPDWQPLYSLFLHHQLPGAGVLPLAQFVRTLLRNGYAGILTFEVSPTAIQAWSLKRVRENLSGAVHFVRQIEAESSAETRPGPKTPPSS